MRSGQSSGHWPRLLPAQSPTRRPIVGFFQHPGHLLRIQELLATSLDQTLISEVPNGTCFEEKAIGIKALAPAVCAGAGLRLAPFYCRSSRRKQ